MRGTEKGKGSRSGMWGRRRPGTGAGPSRTLPMRRYHPTHLLCDVRYWHTLFCAAMRVCYALPDTRVCARSPSPMRCPVLTSAIMLRSGGGRGAGRAEAGGNNPASMLRIPYMRYPVLKQLIVLRISYAISGTDGCYVLPGERAPRSTEQAGPMPVQNAPHLRSAWVLSAICLRTA
eukprot:928831-Rhodomonas_salina.4